MPYICIWYICEFEISKSNIWHIWVCLLPKPTTIRLEKKTKKRLDKHRKKGETFDQLVDKMIDVYEFVKLRVREKSIMIKHLNNLQNDLVDAVNGLRKTYETEHEWKREFPISTFAQALSFDWKAAEFSLLIPEIGKDAPPMEIINLRTKWVREIRRVVEEIKQLSSST